MTQFVDPTVSRETSEEEERPYYSRAEQEADQATADFFDEQARREANARVAKYVPPENPVIVDSDPELVYGLDIEDPSLTRDERAAMVDMVFSYIGVTPRDVDSYVGRWLECLGCVVAPIAADVTVMNQETGEPETKRMKWDAPMFKLAAIDDITDLNVIIAGGGANGKKFARTMTALLGPGDWPKPRMLLISQEARTGVNPITGQPEPRRMYRFVSKLYKPEDKKHGK